MTTAHDRHPEYLEDQRAFFDELVSEDWESYRSASWDALRRYEVAGLFSFLSARRVIDVGCGVGFHDVAMAEEHGVAEVLGIDYSAKSIEVAEREYPHPRVRRIEADVFTLPPADFDLAVSFQVIEHLQDPVAFLEACARQVRSGGAVAVFTPNRMRIDNRLLGVRRRSAELLDPQHFREYTAPELRALGNEAGLRHLGAFGYGIGFTIPKSSRRISLPRLGRRTGRLGRLIGSGLCQVYEV